MPDAPLTPDKRSLKQIGCDFKASPPAPYVELGVTSCFSFLRGASDAVDLALKAQTLGYHAIGIADRNTLAGVVRLHTEAKEAKLRPIIGARLDLIDTPSFLAYPKTRAGYGRLSRLLSDGKMQTLDHKWQKKGECHLTLEMLAAAQQDIQLIVIPPHDLDTAQYPAPFPKKTADTKHLRLVSDHEQMKFEQILPLLSESLPSLSNIAVCYLYRGDDVSRINRLDALARRAGLSILATNDVRYHLPERRPLHDVMACIRNKTTLAEAAPILKANGERYLKSPDEMMRLFTDWPHAISATRDVADACTFSLDELRYEYPEEIVPEGKTAQDQLAELTWEGSLGRYPEGIPDKVRQTVEKELALIGKLDLARYFLTIKDIVDFARNQEPPILCQGRGSAANSAVCYCLEITSVDPAQHALLFDRFISEERKEPPDIDVDFEHERREDVIQYIYGRYGRSRAGLCATVIHYRPRMAIREVGKAMGLSEDVTSALAKTVWGSHGREIGEKNVTETGMDLRDPYLRRVLTLTDQMIGMPRHLSQHVGGFILTQGALTETVPIGNGAMPDRTFIEWDKDDIDALGILKIDVLALGMLTCIRKCLDLMQEHHNRDLTLASVPREDPETYAMLRKGDSLGVFQVESRAQMNMLPRLKPREFYDLVIQVAIVRPGPIQGDMVHPYLKRRRGEEAVEIPYPSPEHGPPDELSSILQRTLGVPIFQEQAMKIALDAARFTPLEANRLRKAMATFRSRGMVDALQDMMVGRMIARGYDPDFSERCFNQIKGFGEYGFPESHAASFAHLVYVSSWLKCHYPAAFCAALLNSQPMGFYAPAQIVRDASEHGVNVRSVDVNKSRWDNRLEDRGFSVRLGFRQIDGLGEAAAARLVAARDHGGPFADVASLKHRAALSPAIIERLADADAFRSIGLDRRQALWDARSVKGLPDLPLFAAAEARDEGGEISAFTLPDMPLSEHVVADYQTMRLSLKAHPMAFLRGDLAMRSFTPASNLRRCKNGSHIKVAGIVLIRQRPGSAKGVCFITLEDESGVINLVIWPDMMEKFRKTVMASRLMEVRGRIEFDDEVTHVIATHLTDVSHKLAELSEDSFPPALARADHINSPLPVKIGSGPAALPAMQSSHPRDAKIIPKSRDFH
ncbi:error-prone DNA polymerase [Pontixanthobacter aestiaquae]|uniref:Error-prone DNA polymerase n=1 Tax=Pontixanthobacter aestiaquae TaxID=1509367 RepID=A0A844ZB66_9SPHN|nr:error-prone DNA polymerase [Pontixanthobacter aestiaquae]MDN3644638.1 error-prone DNA polymerase [Pontixanthobacter aestiaquae]MXO84353.1 DNA polymerase III subunit alpha [Pontixanthobacter aestiaquae]